MLGKEIAAREPNGEEPVVRVMGVSKIYSQYESEVRALDDVSLDIWPGDFTAIIGPSGSGKSTLLNIMGCLDRPTSGTVLIDGKDTCKMSEKELSALRGQKVGFVFQGYNLLPRLTALENVLLPGELQKKPFHKLMVKAKHLLKVVGIDGRSDHKAVHLSGGEQQRVAIARALFNDPVMVLADEPTGALDTKSSAALMKLLKKLNKKEKITTIIITHEPQLAAYARRIVELKDGCIVRDSAPGAG